MPKIKYISNKILEWDWSISGQSLGDSDKANRAYEILKHSESIIVGNPNNFKLADSIGNLKKALNQRLKLIEELYNLKLIKFKGKPKGYLELLENYGLARPYIIKILMEIRNNIEHKDAIPPGIDRCNELLDVTWYFLKSTDKLVYFISMDFELTPKPSFKLPEKYGSTVDINHSNNSLKISGWFPLDYILDKENRNTFKAECSTIHNGLYWKGKNNEYHKNKTKDDIWINGKIDICDDEKQIILKKMFDAF